MGIFVGGKSTRMGGKPKGLLPAPDTEEPIVQKLVRLGREMGMRSILVGEATPYAGLGLAAIADDPEIDGPLGGLAALLDHAGERQVIAVACDMPAVSVEALRALAEHAAEAEVVAPRRDPDGPWEPLFARYDAPRVLPKLRAAASEGARSFQALFSHVDAAVLPPSDVIDAALEDWDTPEDVA
jgi:molybdopterin-guanine dinucleotide biosynthesis protein A